MTAILQLATGIARADLATFLGRAGRIDDAGVRVQQVGQDTVALWVPVLRPAGLLTDAPLVLGVRALVGRITGAEDADQPDGVVDVVVPLRGMLDRLAREPRSEDEARCIPLPPERLLESWTGTRPPQAGWERVANCTAADLGSEADGGIAQITEASGEGLGQLLAERVRTDVWTRMLPGTMFVDVETDATMQQTAPLPPAGAAFAAQALGFIRVGDTAVLSTAPGWWRLALPAGQVLIRRRDVNGR